LILFFQVPRNQQTGQDCEKQQSVLLDSIISQSRESPCLQVSDRQKQVKAWTSVNLNNNNNYYLLADPERLASPGFVFSGY